MRIRVDPEQMLRYVHPDAEASPYADAFGNMQGIFDRYHISASPLRAAHFAAQVMCESAGLRCVEENLHYRVETLVKMWPGRFGPHGAYDPRMYGGPGRDENRERELANLIYGGRYGNTAPDDGSRFRGRGLLQLTFRDNYREASERLRTYDASAPDLFAQPEAVAAPRWALEIAAAFWDKRRGNFFADRDNILKVTQAINGGTNGLRDRKRWLLSMKQAFGA